MILTYKYRLKGKRASRQLRGLVFAVNQVWNYCVQTQRSVQRSRRDGLSPRWPSSFDLAHLTSGTSRDLGLHGQTIQCVCDQFAKSRDLHAKCPGFRKSGGSKRALGWIPFQKGSRQIVSNSVTYRGNTYRFFGVKRRPLPQTAKGGCFVEDARGRWWVCFRVDVAADLQKAPVADVGIDLGLKTLATLSNGKKIDPPRTYRVWEEKLAVAQRAGNKKRAKAINEKIASVRRDHMHKATTWIARSYRTIFIGDVSSSWLAKTNRSKSVFDASWNAFRTTLRYKASRHGGSFQEVSERFTSQICSSCGALSSKSPRGIADLGVREWRCSFCGELHDRDVNAARNIRALGLGALVMNQSKDCEVFRQPPVEESRTRQVALTG